MIPLKVQRLVPRSREKTLRRASKSFETVLLLTSLEDERLYLASEIARIAFHPEKDAERYKWLKENVYQRAHRYGLMEFNDNLDIHGNQQQPAKWSGTNWKGALKNHDWQRACQFYDTLRERDVAHRRLGRQLHYFYDDAVGLIETIATTREQVKEWLPMANWERGQFTDRVEIVSMMSDPNKLYPGPSSRSAEPPPEEASPPRSFWRCLFTPSRIAATLATLVMFTLTWQWASPSPYARQMEQLYKHRQQNGQVAVEKLWRLQQERDLRIERAYIIDALLDKILEEPTSANLGKLRELYRDLPKHREQIAWTIAELHKAAHFNPLFPRTPFRPIFLAAIDENPVIIYEEGHLRPGDWVNVDGVTGFVRHISPEKITLRSNEHEYDMPLQIPKVLGVLSKGAGNVISYEGQPNLRRILRTIAEIDHLDFYDTGIVGHVGGIFQVNSYSEFIDIVAAQSPIAMRKNQVFSLDEHTFIVVLGSLSSYAQSSSLSDLMNNFSAQIGLEITFNAEGSLPEEELTFVKIQWDDFLKAYQLKCQFDSQSKQLTLSRVGGLGNE